MKKQTLLKLTAAAVLASAPAGADASSVQEVPVLGSGVPYRWLVQMSGTDSASLSRHVGAWAWEDESLFKAGEPSVGWTHNAEWLKLSLATPVVLTIRLENTGDVLLPTVPGNPEQFAGNNLYPGFTLWSGWDEDGDQVHSFANKGNVIWAEDLTYVGHKGPPTTGEQHERHMIESTFPLAAGNYTFVFGGNSESNGNEIRQGYLATFTTTSVPEPGTAGLLLLGGVTLLARRRRR